eukprot:gene18911-biopygen21997
MRTPRRLRTRQTGIHTCVMPPSEGCVGVHAGAHGLRRARVDGARRESTTFPGAAPVCPYRVLLFAGPAKRQAWDLAWEGIQPLPCLPLSVTAADSRCLRTSAAPPRSPAARAAASRGAEIEGNLFRRKNAGGPGLRPTKQACHPTGLSCKGVLTEYYFPRGAEGEGVEHLAGRERRPAAPPAALVADQRRRGVRAGAPRRGGSPPPAAVRPGPPADVKHHQGETAADAPPGASYTIEFEETDAPSAVSPVSPISSSASRDSPPSAGSPQPACTMMWRSTAYMSFFVRPPLCVPRRPKQGGGGLKPP